MMTIKKCHFLLFFIAALFLIFSAESSFAQDAVPDVKVTCDDHPGFVNKIVKCITHMVTVETIEGVISDVHDVFVLVSNVAIVLYIMFFGLKLMLGGVENVKSEVFIVVITASLILYMNNTTKIVDVMKLFILGQSEFANAATAAISTSPIQNDDTKPEMICVGPHKVVGTYPNTSVVPVDKNNNQVDPFSPDRAKFSTWQRVDCIVGYLLGAHPVFERRAQIFEKTDTEEDHIIPGQEKNKFDYDIFAGDENPFANMAEDPFEFLQGSNAKITENYESFISFSLITIAVGMLFDESGGIGMIVMISGLFVVFLMIAAFGQAVIIYLTSLFAIVVLALFAPIIIPMFMFRVTRRIFDFWLQMFFTYMLQPGIMLAYLSFMIFVLQYVLEYSGNSVTSKNMIEYHFGDAYINAKKGTDDAVTISSNIDSSFKENSNYLYKNVDELGALFNDFIDLDTYGTQTVVGNENEQENEGKRKVSERGNVLDTLFKSFSDTDTNMSMMSNSSLKLPQFKFDSDVSADVQQQLLAQISLLDSIPGAGTANPTEFLRNAQNNPILNNLLTDANAQKEKQEFQNAISYMQNLLIVFLTMSMTFAFMQNVMAFGSEMAGAGTLPVNQMVNIYNGYTTKMANSLK